MAAFFLRLGSYRVKFNRCVANQVIYFQAIDTAFANVRE
jgi:hypothetical protein